MKTEIQELNDRIYLLEKSVKTLEKTVKDLSKKISVTYIRTVTKSSYVKIPKRLAKDGDIVGIFKLEEDKQF